MVSRYDNVNVSVEGSEVVIRCRVEDVQAAPSASGKTMVFATTGGARAVPVGDGVMQLNLTLYQKR